MHLNLLAESLDTRGLEVKKYNLDERQLMRSPLPHSTSRIREQEEQK